VRTNTTVAAPTSRAESDWANDDGVGNEGDGRRERSGAAAGRAALLNMRDALFPPGKDDDVDDRALTKRLIRSIANNTVFPKRKFVDTDEPQVAEDVKRRYKDYMRDRDLEWGKEEFGVLKTAISDRRSFCSSSLKKIFLGKLVWWMVAPREQWVNCCSSLFCPPACSIGKGKSGTPDLPDTFEDVLESMRDVEDDCYFVVCRDFLPSIVGRNRWNAVVKSADSLTEVATKTDEAFMLLLLDNHWEVWKNPADSGRKTKYTSSAGKGYNCGWSNSGRERYRLFRMMVEESRATRPQWDKDFVLRLRGSTSGGSDAGGRRLGKFTRAPILNADWVNGDYE
jgi:hypothetical protein